NSAAAALTLVSHSTAGPLAGGNGDSSAPSISGDGRYIAFASASTNLVPNFVDGNGATASDVFVYDRVTGLTALAIHQAAPQNVSGNQGAPGVMRISTDGRYVVFADLATDLISGFIDSNSTSTVGNSGCDVFRYDGTTGTVALVTGSGGSPTTSENKDCGLLF